MNVNVYSSAEVLRISGLLACLKAPSVETVRPSFEKRTTGYRLRDPLRERGPGWSKGVGRHPQEGSSTQPYYVVQTMYNPQIYIHIHTYTSTYT